MRIRLIGKPGRERRTDRRFMPLTEKFLFSPLQDDAGNGDLINPHHISHERANSFP
jgi:hypothetical protein